MARRSMRRDIASDEAVGARIAEWAKKRGLRHVELATLADMDPGTLSNIIHGWEHAGPVRLERIAKRLGLEVSDLLIGDGGRIGVDGGNTKPVRLGDLVLRNLYLMCGNNIEPLELHAKYDHKAIRKGRQIRKVYDDLAARAKKRAEAHGFPFFNGPNTRLLRVTDSKTRQLPSGLEQKGHVLELGPVSWEEYTVLNEFLDVPIFEENRRETIRRQFADRELLYAYERDLRWCELSNILSVIMIPVTSDGFGLIQMRGAGVSADPGRITGGVAENIHRYLDEAEEGKLTKPLHAWEPASELISEGVDSKYRPRGVPSPYVTAQRGLMEELSVELYRHVQAHPDCLKFLSLMFDMDKFHPMLGGIIELGLSRTATEKMLQESPGRDHTEFRSVEFLSLDANNRKTRDLLTKQGSWISTGLGAFVGAMIYWRARGN